MSMALKASICALILILATGCQDRAATANEAIEIGNAYLANEPEELSLRTVEAIDMGDRWRLSYRLPEGSTGGPLIVVVSKRSGEVVHAETEQ
jgi:hypothetical protein